MFSSTVRSFIEEINGFFEKNQIQDAVSFWENKIKINIKNLTDNKKKKLILAWLDLLETKTKSIKNQSENLVLSNILKNEFQEASKLIEDKDFSNMCLSKMNYYSFLLSIKPLSKYKYLSDSYDYIKKIPMKKTSVKLLIYQGWILFYLRLYEKDKDKRNNLFKINWNLMKTAIGNSHKIRDISNKLRAIELVGWLIADSRLSLPFDDWWKLVEQLRKYLSQIETPLFEKIDSVSKCIYYHWLAMYESYQFFKTQGSNDWKDSNSYQLSSIKNLELAVKFAEESNDTFLNGVTKGRLISKSRSSALGWTTYSQLENEILNLLSLIESTLIDYYIALSKIWGSNYFFRISWLENDGKLKQKKLKQSEDFLDEALSKLKGFSGPERQAYPLRRKSFIQTQLAKNTKDIQVKQQLIKKSREFAEEAVSSASETNNEPLKLDMQESIVNVWRYLSQSPLRREDKLENLKNVIKLSKSRIEQMDLNKRPKTFILFSIDIGNLLLDQWKINKEKENLIEAQDYLKEALEIANKIGENECKIQIHSNLAMIDDFLGKYSNSAEHLFAAAAFLSKTKPITSKGFKGWGFYEIGKESTQTEAHQTARDAFRQASNNFNAAPSFKIFKDYTKGLMFLEQGYECIAARKSKKGIEYFEKAILQFSQTAKTEFNPSIDTIFGPAFDNNLINVYSKNRINYCKIVILIEKGKINSISDNHKKSSRNFQKASLLIENLNEEMKNIIDIKRNILLSSMIKIWKSLEDYWSQIKPMGLTNIIDQTELILPQAIEWKQATLMKANITYLRAIELVVDKDSLSPQELELKYEELIHLLSISKELFDKFGFSFSSNWIESSISIIKGLKELITKRKNSTVSNTKLEKAIKELEKGRKIFHEIKYHKKCNLITPLIIKLKNGRIGEIDLGLLLRSPPDFWYIPLNRIFPLLLEPFLFEQKGIEKRDYEVEIKEDTSFQYDYVSSKTVFDFLLQEYIKDSFDTDIQLDEKGYRSLSKIMTQTKLQSVLIYGPLKREISPNFNKQNMWPSNRPYPGEAIVELIERGLIEIKLMKKSRGRGGNIISIRIDHQKPEIKMHIKNKIEVI
ncbi:MAG: hypothetical protein ACTSUV_04705 [Candidatus Ranarchaeia archaeon]